MTKTEINILEAVNKHLRDGNCHPDIQVVIVVHIQQEPEAATADELNKLSTKLDTSANALASAVAANTPA